MKDLWKRYKESKAVKLDLSNVGLPECSVRVVPVSALSPVQLMRIVQTTDDMVEQQRVAMKEVVLDWDIPDENGEPLPIPARSDKWLDILPTEVIVHIIRTVHELGQQAMEGNPQRTPRSLQRSEGEAADQSG